MGMIRKTMSIGTLGLVSFRSKKEKLEIAEWVVADIEAQRDLEAAARADAEHRANDVAKQLKARTRRRRKAEAKTLLQKSAEAVEEVGHAVASSAKAAEPAVRKGSKAAQKQAEKAAARGKKLRGSAKRRAKKASKEAGRSVRDVRATAVDQAHHLADVAVEQAHHLADAAKEQATETKDALVDAVRR